MIQRALHIFQKGESVGTRHQSYGALTEPLGAEGLRPWSGCVCMKCGFSLGSKLVGCLGEVQTHPQGSLRGGGDWA